MREPRQPKTSSTAAHTVAIFSTSELPVVSWLIERSAAPTLPYCDSS